MVDTGLTHRAAIPDPRSLDLHIVDVLIEERAKHLRHQPVVWWLIKTLLFPVLRYADAVRMADHIAALGGLEVFDWLLEELRLNTVVEGLEHVPRSGPCVVVANHPTGIVDGLALYQAIRPVRADLCYFANRDALRVAPRLSDLLIPVEWVVEKRSIAKTRDMWRYMKNAFDRQQAVVMFPSGRVAQRIGGRLVDRPWQPTTVNLVRKNAAPIVPLHVQAVNSFLFYFLAKVSQELKDMTLFNELLNKKGKTFRLTFGPPIAPDDLTGAPEDEILRLRRYIEDDLPRGTPWPGPSFSQR